MPAFAHGLPFSTKAVLPTPFLRLLFLPGERSSGTVRLLSGTSEVSSAQHPRTSLSPQRLMSLMCFTREDQRTSLDTSGLVSFGASEEEIAVDDSMSLTASDTDEWVCSGEEPEAPPPSQSTRPSRADPRSHARCGGTRSRVVSPRRACPQPPRRVVPEGTSSAFLQSASSSIYACGPRRAHENMAGSIFSVFEPLYCSGSHHRWRRWWKGVLQGPPSGGGGGCTPSSADEPRAKDCSASFQALQDGVSTCQQGLCSGWPGRLSPAYDVCAASVSGQTSPWHGRVWPGSWRLHRVAYGDRSGPACYQGNDAGSGQGHG